MSLYLGAIPIANDGRHRITGKIGDIVLLHWRLMDL